MPLTLVTSLYDLSKRDANHQHRSVDWMFANSSFVLEQLEQPLVVFTEPELVDEIKKRRGDKPIIINTTPYERLLGPERIAAINRGKLQDNATRTKVTRAYVQLMWAKYAMLEYALSAWRKQLLATDHLGWIDFGITHVGKVTPGLAQEIFADPPEYPRVHMLRYFDIRDVADAPAYWANVHGHLAGGLVVGRTPHMTDLIRSFWNATAHATVYGLAPLDEGLLSYIVGQTRATPEASGARAGDQSWTFKPITDVTTRPHKFECSYGDYEDILRNHDKIRGGAGHLRWQMEDAEQRGVGYHMDLLKQSMTAPSVGTATLGLVAIVKNEAHGIVNTLASFKPFIDRYTILDTGSTDGTQELIKKTLHDIPGTLHEEPFIDFATSRNRALALHGTQTTFTIMPDADDRLVNGEALRAFLVTHFDESEPAYTVNIRRGELDYWLPLVLRTEAAWRYRGRVHEFLGPQTGSGFATVRISGPQVIQSRPAQSHEASAKRWERDLVLLRDEFLADPSNPRTLFYLAQTFECLSRPAEALPVYERRIAIGGWVEETFEAMLRRAKILNALNRPWAEVQQAFLETYKLDPRRAEPLFYIAEHWYAEQVHALCTLFAARAAKLPAPSTALFLDRDIYTHRAANLAAISGFYCDGTGDPSIKSDGRRFAEHAVRGQPSNELYRSNWAFYALTAPELFPGATIHQIDWHPEAPYTASNPSILYDRGKWRCVVRTTNYTIVNGQYLTPDDNVIYTRNWMIEFDEHAPHPSWKAVAAYEMTDQTGLVKTGYPVHGYEDCRVFIHNDQYYCSSTVCDFTEDGAREIVIITLDPTDYHISKAWPVRGPWSDRAQKNWMPLVDHRHGVDDLNFIYATAKPTTLLQFNLDTETGLYFKQAVQQNNPGAFVTVENVTQISLGYGRLRGGSQAVRVPDGWLFITHDVTWSGHARTYLHRFVFMNDNYEVISMTDPFYFKRRGIEFCAGLALGRDGAAEILVASFSVEDREANVAVFNLAVVLGKLRSDYTI